MKTAKYVLALIFTVCFFQTSSGQNLSPQTIERLAYTAKVWGYLKYFHPSVDGCQKDMDTVLLGILPLVKSATTNEEFNAALRTMISFAGPVPKGGGVAPTFEPREIKHLQLDWLDDQIFAEDIRLILDSVRVNARYHEQCYYENNLTPSQAEPYFYIDNERLYPEQRVMQESYRLLLLFRYWNIINYFYPYKYLMTTSWDNTLTDFIPIVTSDSTILSFHLAMGRLQSRLDDAHGFTSSSRFYQYFGTSYVPFTIAFREGKTVVTHVFDDTVDVKQGDVILSIDGVEITHFRDSVRDYASGSNPASKERNINDFLIRAKAQSATFVLDDGNGQRTVHFRRYFTGSRYYDSLNVVPERTWKILPGNFGYVDMGNIIVDSVESMYNDLKNTKAIIFDVRNYPQGTMYEICDRIHPQEYTFVKFTFPDATYAGSMYFDEDGYTCGPAFSNPNWYQGKVIILFNEETQSHAEFTIMSLEVHPNAVKIGSQTAGADGNIMIIDLLQGLQLYFTSLGVYYPDWGETQRVGIVPDIVVHPTVSGIRAGRDEVLEEALRVASSVKALSFADEGLEVFPTPFDNTIHIESPSPSIAAFTVTVQDMLGRTVLSIPEQEFSNHSYTLHLPADLASGAYMLQLSHHDGVLRQIVVKR